jgi:putative heme transporter
MARSGRIGFATGRPAARERRQAVPRGARKVLRGAVSAALIAAAFGFALPRFASYHSVWANLQAMTWPYVLLVGVAAAASLASYWFGICAVLPSLRLRQAAAVNLSSNAVANTLPAGGALGMGVNWAMLSSWGVGTEEYVLYTLLSGIWNVFARLGLPVLALLALLTVTRPDAVLITSAAVGLGLLAAAAAGLGLLMRSERFALRADHVLQHAAATICRLARREAPTRIAGSLTGFRSRAAGLLAARGWRITVTTAAAQLILWLVLLACLRVTGLSQAQVSWQTSLAAYAFVRLLTVLPLTPGGLGITELGLVGVLAPGAGPRATAQVTAAVLLYRAVTYLPPIPLGAAAFLVWRHAPALIHPAPAASAGPPVPALPQPAVATMTSLRHPSPVPTTPGFAGAPRPTSPPMGMWALGSPAARLGAGSKPLPTGPRLPPAHVPSGPS